MALKHIVFKLFCAWSGHEPTIGSYYSVVRGRRINGIVCKHCLKVL